MGLGDDLMWRGEAYALHKQTGKRIRPHRANPKYGVPRKESRVAWQDADWIHNDGELPLETHPNAGKRWYQRGTPYRPKISPIEFSEQETHWFNRVMRPKLPYVIINPYVKSKSKYKYNKYWPHFQELMLMMPKQNYVLLQQNEDEVETLAQCNSIFTPHTKMMMIAVKHAHSLVTTEGGMHHTAGNFSIPTVVIRGSCIGSKTTGYANQIDVERSAECSKDAKIGCHTMTRCASCEDTMQKITPRTVLKAYEKCLTLRSIDELNNM